MATVAPTRAARRSRPFEPHFGSVASLSISVRNQTRAIKITINSIVESPDTEKRQKSSLPSNKTAESHATAGSNKRFAQKNTATINSRNTPWLKRLMAKSDLYHAVIPPPQEVLPWVLKNFGMAFITPASTRG